MPLDSSGRRYVNPNAAPNLPTKRQITLRIWRDVCPVAAGVLGTVVFCAALYWLGSLCDMGIESTTAERHKVSFADCLHFSIVTIATLGYGDFRPVSWGRVVAGMEVFSGIVLMGVFVSRLASRETTRLTRRLLKGQMNGEIKGFRVRLESVQVDLNSAAMGQSQTQRLHHLKGLKSLLQGIARFWRFESEDPELGAYLPRRAAARLVGDILATLDSVLRLFEGVACGTVTADEKTSLENMSDAALASAEILSKLTEPDASFRHQLEQMESRVERLRAVG